MAISKTQIKHKVLTIDDEESVRDLLTSILVEAGYDVITASNGTEGLKISTEEKVDLIILDLVMPGFNGFQVCERLRANNATKTTPILVLTGLAGTEEMEMALNAGADDFVTKPIRMKELLARVKSLLKIKGMDDNLLRALTYIEELETNRCNSEKERSEN